MSICEVSGHKFDIGKMSARQQFHVARRLAPLFADAFGDAISSSSPEALTGDNLQDILKNVAGGLAHLSDSDSDYIVDNCLSVVKYLDENTKALFPIMHGKAFAYSWIDLPIMMKLTAEVIKDNLGSFMNAAPFGTPGAGAA